MNQQITIRAVVAFAILLSISVQPITAQDQIFPSGKLGYANVASIAWSSRGDLLAVANGLTIDLIDAVSYKRVVLLTGYTQEVLSVAFSPNGHWLASGGDDNTVKLWDASNWSEITSLAGHIDRVSSVAFSPDSRWLVSGSSDTTIKVWNTSSWTETTTLEGAYEISRFGLFFAERFSGRQRRRRLDHQTLGYQQLD